MNIQPYILSLSLSLSPPPARLAPVSARVRVRFNPNKTGLVWSNVLVMLCLVSTCEVLLQVKCIVAPMIMGNLKEPKHPISFCLQRSEFTMDNNYADLKTAHEIFLYKLR